MAVLPPECGGSNGCAILFDNGECSCFSCPLEASVVALRADVRLVPGHLTHLMGTLIIASGALSHLLPAEGASMNPADVSSVAIASSTPALGASGVAQPSAAAADALDAFDAEVERILQEALGRIMVLRPRDSVQWISMLREVTDRIKGGGAHLTSPPPSSASSAAPTHNSARAAVDKPASHGLADQLQCLDLLSLPRSELARLVGSSSKPPGAPPHSPAADGKPGQVKGAPGTSHVPQGPFNWGAVSLIAVDSIGTFRHHDKYLLPSVGVPLLHQVLAYLRTLQAATGCSILYSKPVLYAKGGKGSTAGSAAPVEEGPQGDWGGGHADFAKRTEEWLPRDWAEGHVTHRIKCRMTDILAPSAVRLPLYGAISGGGSQVEGCPGEGRGGPAKAAVSAVSCLVREAHLVKPYMSQEQGSADAMLPRVQAFVVCEAGPIVSLSPEDVALAAAEQASMPTVHEALQKLEE